GEFEGGVLSGGTDKGDGAALDVGENSILLGLVEAVDLIYEEDGAPPGHAQELAGILHDATEISDACGDSAKGDEAGVGDAGDDGGKGGLAAARRSPENHRGNAVTLNGAAERPAWGEQVLLPDDLIKRARAHAGGKGLRLGRRGIVAPRHACAQGVGVAWLASARTLARSGVSGGSLGVAKERGLPLVLVHRCPPVVGRLLIGSIA